jgi:hypothetical protein
MTAASAPLVGAGSTAQEHADHGVTGTLVWSAAWPGHQLCRHGMRPQPGSGARAPVLGLAGGDLHVLRPEAHAVDDVQDDGQRDLGRVLAHLHITGAQLQRQWTSLRRVNTQQAPPFHAHSTSSPAVPGTRCYVTTHRHAARGSAQPLTRLLQPGSHSCQQLQARPPTVMMAPSFMRLASDAALQPWVTSATFFSIMSLSSCLLREW